MSDDPATPDCTFELELDDDLLSEAVQAVERRMQKPTPLPDGEEIEIELDFSDEDADQSGPTPLEKMLAKENSKLMDKVSSLESKLAAFKSDASTSQEMAKDAMDTMRKQALKAKRTASAADAMALELEDARSNVAANERLTQDLRGALRDQQSDHVRSRERHQRNLSEEVRQKGQRIFLDLLEVMDNLDRASAHLPAASDDLFVEGVVMTVKQLEKSLARHGVVRIDAGTGLLFDPEVHEAIGRVITSKVEINHIVEVHQAGYTLDERLLRPAKVSVSTEPVGDEE